jgi:hypothetical protein
MVIITFSAIANPSFHEKIRAKALGLGRGTPRRPLFLVYYTVKGGICKPLFVEKFKKPSNQPQSAGNGELETALDLGIGGGGEAVLGTAGAPPLLPHVEEEEVSVHLGKEGEGIADGGIEGGVMPKDLRPLLPFLHRPLAAGRVGADRLHHAAKRGGKHLPVPLQNAAAPY